jgi:serine protein kinase
MFLKDPAIAQLSVQRFLEIILAAGMEDIPEDEQWIDWRGRRITRRPVIFSELYGVDAPIHRIMCVLACSPLGYSVDQMLKNIVGPPGSGKSTFVSILVRALWQRSLRKIFRIKGCPYQEEPLHLLPRYLQERLMKEHGIQIVGDLCPICRHNLLSNFVDEDGVVRWWDVPVESFNFSKQGGIGIGSHEPTDAKSSDIAALVGKENIAVTADPTRGHQDPMAYDLRAGAIERANRGFLEFREDLKEGIDVSQLWPLFDLCQEREIFVAGSGMPQLGIDTFTVGHCNLHGFKWFAENEANEGLHRRIFVIEFPYPLQIRNEIKIIKKLLKIGADDGIRRPHFCEQSIWCAAAFSVASRLRPDSEFSPVRKALMYDSPGLVYQRAPTDKVVNVADKIMEGGQDSDVSRREGMFGINPSDIQCALALEAAYVGPDGCVTPVNTIEAISAELTLRMGLTSEEIDHYREILVGGNESVLAIQHGRVIENITTAFVRAFSDLGRAEANNYLSNLLAWREARNAVIESVTVDDQGVPSLSDDPPSYNEKFMSRIEKHMGWSGDVGAARRELLSLRDGRVASGEIFGYDTYGPLKEAADSYVFECNYSLVGSMLDPVQLADPKAKEAFERLIVEMRNMGYCDICMKEAFRCFRESIKKSSADS